MKRFIPLITVLALFLMPLASADRGMIIPGPISVHEPGQKAIIGWDGDQEILILSTDVYASENTWALEIIPFPSEPEVKGGDFSSFENMELLVNQHMIKVFNSEGYGVPVPGQLEVIFQENIGAHGLTCVKGENASALTGWAENFLLSMGYEENILWDRLENIAARYISDGIDYFVFDLVDLSDQEKSRQPLIYTFGSDFLYYPLEISSLASGETEITLFTLTKEKPSAENLEETGFKIRSLETGEAFSEPIQFEVENDELLVIDSGLASLFEGPVWLTVLSYDGQIENLKGDLIISAAADETVEVERLGHTLATTVVIVIICVMIICSALLYRAAPKEEKVG